MAKASSSIDLRPAKDASKTATNYISFTEADGLDIGYTGKTERTNIKPDGMRIYDGNSSTEPVASFTSNGSQLGRNNENRSIITPDGQSFISDVGTEWFRIAKSNNPTSDQHTHVDTRSRFTQSNTKDSFASSPDSGTTITVDSVAQVYKNNGTVAGGKLSPHAINTFTVGTAATVTNTKSVTLSGTKITVKWSVSYDPSDGKGSITANYISATPEHSQNYARLETVSYLTSDNAVDLGTMTFGLRRGTSQGNGSILLGKGLESATPYQTVIGKYNKTDSDALFVVGDGTFESYSNSFAVLPNGKAWHKGDGLYTKQTDIIEINTDDIFRSDVTYKFSVYIWGKVAMLSLSYTRSSAVASGQNIVTATIKDEFRPILQVGSASYYAAHAINAMLNTSGKLTVRNASPSSVTVSTNNTVTFTYLLKN